jgi:hypothetical protein
VAENHRRDIPECVLEAGQGEADPDRRILKMLAARGKNLAKPEVPKAKEAAFAASISTARAAKHLLGTDPR